MVRAAPTLANINALITGACRRPRRRAALRKLLARRLAALV